MTTALHAPRTLAVSARHAFALLMLAGSVGCVAEQQLPRDWRVDCVGRFILALPGPAQLAVTPNDYLAPMMSKGPSKGSPKHAFDDGEAAGFAGISYDSGNWLVSEPLSDEALRSLLQAHVSTRLNHAKKLYSGRIAPSGEKYRLSIVETGLASATAWRAEPGQLYVAARVGDRLVDFGMDVKLAGTGSDKVAVQSRVQQLRPRPAFTVPEGTGTCIPYAFIEDDGQQARNVAVTYRLDALPDIQITMKDASAVAHEPGVRSRNNEPESATVSFWSQLLTSVKQVKPLWSPTTRPSTLAGYSGVSSFVQLTREDETIDHGFLVIVRGDPKAKEDKPDLMLYIVQDGKLARSRGKQPMTREAFIATAEAVAASVRRR